MNKKAGVIFDVLFIVLIFILGFACSQVVNAYLGLQTIDDSLRTVGTWSKNATTEWICVDIHEMDFDRAVEVCRHEVGHEIFAEVCEDDWERCAKITRNETKKRD